MENMVEIDILVNALEQKKIKVLQNVQAPHEIIIMGNKLVIINPNTIKESSIEKMIDKYKIQNQSLSLLHI